MDDEPEIREIERAYLELMGYEVTDVKGQTLPPRQRKYRKSESIQLKSWFFVPWEVNCTAVALPLYLWSRRSFSERGLMGPHPSLA